MKPRWEDLAARAHGLMAHLLDRHAFDVLASAANLEELREALRSRGFPVADEAGTAEQLELAVRRSAAARLRILTRWSGARNPVLAVIFEDEDRRSLRAVVRGAAQGAPPELRLAGLIPTPGLPERALRALGDQATPRAIALLLTAWDHPYGPPLLPETAATQPDLLAVEYCLNRTFAARALRGAHAARNRVLLAYVRSTIDLENACAALVIVANPTDAPAKRAFVDGGRLLPLPLFLQAVAAGEAGVAARLAAVFRPAGLAMAFQRWSGSADPGAIEQRLLHYRIMALRAEARRDPAGPAAVLEFALRLRAEMLDLRRLIWGVTLGAPRADIAAGLVSA